MAGDASTSDTVQVTETSTDPRYGEAFVDVDEWRDDPEHHRYVHGGFVGTDARFSLYFPPAERYGGRFFHNTYPLIVTEDIAPFPIAFEVATGNLGFTLDSGAYYVQTNLGGADRRTDPDPAIGAYRVNAAAAKYSRVVAAEMFGDHRPYGYLFGGSGGSYQVMGAAEATRGVWDGFLPFVLGTPNAVPSMFTVRMHALRVLRRGDSWPAVVDAVDPGGSGDPYADLDDEERAALREATLLGFPLRSWWNHVELDSGYLGQVLPMIRMVDPTYGEDFWRAAGYLGADPDSSIHDARVLVETTVTKVLHEPEPELELADLPDRDFADADLVVLSGDAAGQTLTIGPRGRPPIRFSVTSDRTAFGKLRAGDRVRIDNSWALALQTYQRHQLPATDDLYGWNQFRDADGEPLYPQRTDLTGQRAAADTIGADGQGRVNGKVLVLECLMDIDALPWQADWYRSTVKAAMGPGFEDSIALWFIDHAQHDNPQTPAARAHTVSYEGALQQGLRDLASWVERGDRPHDTRYEVVDTQVRVPADAAERGGIQPVVTLTANGAVRANVAVGDPVVLEGAVEVPPGAGTVVDAEWCFDGRCDYTTAPPFAPADRVRVSATHAFEQPGTYFPVLRATSQREGDPSTPYGRIQNIARARVVVTERDVRSADE